MKQVIRTKKLKGAASILAGEQFCDCHPEEIYAAIKFNILSYDQIYKALFQMGFSWNLRTGVWKRNTPAWVWEWHTNSIFEKARQAAPDN